MMTSTHHTTVLQMNDDCLINIFSYLNDYQLIDILGTCPKFDEIIHILLRRCKKLSFNFRFFNTTSEDEKLLWLVRPYLTTIELGVGYSIGPELVLKALRPVSQCPNLTTLTLHYVTMCDEYLELIKRVSNQLEQIDFSFCSLTDSLMEDFFKNHCNSLKTLVVIGNYTLVGRSLSYVRDLKSLVMEDHDTFSPDFDMIKSKNPTADIFVFSKGRQVKRNLNL